MRLVMAGVEGASGGSYSESRSGRQRPLRGMGLREAVKEAKRGSPRSREISPRLHYHLYRLSAAPSRAVQNLVHRVEVIESSDPTWTLHKVT